MVKKSCLFAWSNQNYFSVEVNCGATTNENNTYFTSSGSSGTLGECRVKFCRADDNICQVKGWYEKRILNIKCWAYCEIWTSSSKFHDSNEHEIIYLFIFQLRLDFETFTITGPSSGSGAASPANHNGPDADLGKVTLAY